MSAGDRRAPAGVAAALCFVVVAQTAGATDIPSPAAEVSSTPTLRAMAAETAAIVLAEVTAVEDKDGGKLRAYHLDIQRVYSGSLDGTKATAAEIRAGIERPAWVAAGRRAIFYLAPPPPYSYLRKHLGDRPYFVVVGDRNGTLVIEDGADASVFEAIVRSGLAIGPGDTQANLETRKRLIFDELAGDSERLLADAIVELRRLTALTELGEKEIRAIERTIGNRNLNAVLRADLIEALSDKRPGALLPVIERVEPDSPEVLAASLRARARLGKPAARAEVERRVASDDDAMRAAAVIGIALAPEPDVLDRLGRLATTDDSVAVRTAAIDALARTADGGALTWLRKSFESDDRPVRQASARAILAIGGESADDTLGELATDGASAETRLYATVLLLGRYPRDHPRITRIDETTTDADVRELLEHGLRAGGMHEHLH